MKSNNALAFTNSPLRNQRKIMDIDVKPNNKTNSPFNLQNLNSMICTHAQRNHRIVLMGWCSCVCGDHLNKVTSSAESATGQLLWGSKAATAAGYVRDASHKRYDQAEEPEEVTPGRLSALNPSRQGKERNAQERRQGNRTGGFQLGSLG
jgi:hypothetical protein